ncbi:MAG TPA: VOC family protein [Candidatus Koribacter sp.]|jgi:PhnB protein
MKSINVYLMFDGNCRAAFEFYKQCLGGELRMFKYSEAPKEMSEKLPPGSGDRIMHVALVNGAALLMGSDQPAGTPFTAGNNFHISVSCDNNEQVDKFTKAISEGGSVIMPPSETFWSNRFSMCTDKFGIEWMFNHEKPMQAGA